jgi:hypothetical protein
MVYPNAIAVQLFINKKVHSFVAKWSKEKTMEIAPAADVAKEVVRALVEITQYITKGILEGFPEPAVIVAPDGKPLATIVGLGGQEIKAPEKEETEQ